MVVLVVVVGGVVLERVFWRGFGEVVGVVSEECRGEVSGGVLEGVIEMRLWGLFLGGLFWGGVVGSHSSW